MFSITTICHQTCESRHPLLMLTSREGSRYLLGKVPEGAQRVLNENGFRLGKLRLVFLTGILLSWLAVGGLPGLFLTITDATGRGLDVFTNLARILSYIVATWRYFVFRRGTDLNVLDTTDQSYIGDASTVFFPIKIGPDRSPQAEPSAEHYSRLRKLTLLMFPGSKTPGDHEAPSYVALPDPNKLAPIADQESLSFLVRFLPVRGKFDAARAKALGVRPGNKYRQLTDGETVLSEDGTPVTPDQVLGEPKLFPKVLVLDVPSNEYLRHTVSSEEWFLAERGPEPIGLVIHLLGDDIDFRLPEYVAFMQKFPAQCKHVVSHRSCADNTLVFRTLTAHLLKLKTVMNGSFNLPHCEAHSEEAGVHKLQSMQQFLIDPTGVTVSDQTVPCESLSEIYDKEVDNPTAREEVLGSTPISLGPVPEPRDLKDHVQIVTLGTGLALPTISRNVLSTLVRIPFADSDGKITFTGVLLDGGENTFGTLVRNYGHNGGEQLAQIFRELGLIYLSHLHADHHLGLISVMESWFVYNGQTPGRKLHVVVPWQYKAFVREWVRLKKLVVDLEQVVFLDCEHFSPNPETAQPQVKLADADLNREEARSDAPLAAEGTTPPNQEKLSPKPKEVPQANAQDWAAACQDIHLMQLQTVRAIHCNWAYSVAMTFDLGNNETFKLSFSGDTRPNTRFAEIGKHSDLLIHEASLENELIEEALAKKHTTVAEAIFMAQMMACRHVVLTHFSARFLDKHSFIGSLAEYLKACHTLRKQLGSDSFNIFNNSVDVPFDSMEICYAYDLMTVRYQDLGKQKNHFEEINALDTADQTEVQVLRDERQNQRRNEKQELKRQQRLAQSKKRKVQEAK